MLLHNSKVAIGIRMAYTIHHLMLAKDLLDLGSFPINYFMVEPGKHTSNVHTHDQARVTLNVDGF